MPNGRGDGRGSGSRPLFGPGSRRHGMGIEKAKNARGTLRRLLFYMRKRRFKIYQIMRDQTLIHRMTGAIIQKSGRCSMNGGNYLSAPLH